MCLDTSGLFRAIFHSYKRLNLMTASLISGARRTTNSYKDKKKNILLFPDASS